MRRLMIVTGFALALLTMCSAFLIHGDEPKTDRFEQKLLEIAKDYQQWGRVDDEARWAPYLCRLPKPAKAKFSESDDEASHGQKLYSLFAKDREAYVALTGDASNRDQATADSASDSRSDPPEAAAKASPLGQVVVKESWTAKPVAKPKLDAFGNPPTLDRDEQDRFSPYAERDGKWFKCDEKSALFIMFRVDPKTPGADEGWVYGTVSADGKKVTSVGLVKSCMKCHTEAPHGRLFGLDR